MIGFRLGALAVALAAAVLIATATGSTSIPPSEVWTALVGGAEPATRAIVWELRLPRALLAALVGGALALAGAVFQALLRNPLAEPYVLGVSGGAAVGAVLAIVTGTTVLSRTWTVPLGAFAGALLAIWLVLRIASAVGPTLNARVFILAGVVVAAFFNAVILLLLALADVESFRSAMFWMMGSLSGSSWAGVGVLAAFVGIGCLVLVPMARPLNLLAVGDETASYLGLNVQAAQRTAYLLTSLLVAATVSVSGVIGFVGLIVPHAVRYTWGNDHRLLLPASLLAGGAFLTLTDALTRTVGGPVELPTGVITALIGVPLFVWLLIRGTA